jgi:DNA-binding NtrC family response regulator
MRLRCGGNGSATWNTGGPREWRRWADLDYPVLVCGEKGTGKTRLARLLHEWSGRRGRFVEMATGLLAPGLEAAAFMGHVKGAFTGAVRSEPGALITAENGTLFLDEIHNSSVEWRRIATIVLDEPGRAMVTAVGSSTARLVGVRIIAATNRDLDAMAAQERFPADLLDRFGFYRITLRPLRDRRHEILPLVDSELRGECARRSRAVPELAPQVIRLLRRAPWPGNIRDLVNVCRYLAGNAGEVILPRDLPPGFLRALGMKPGTVEEPPRVRARRALREHGGNKSAAAREAGMSRSHLYRLIDPEGNGGGKHS